MDPRTADLEFEIKMLREDIASLARRLDTKRDIASIEMQIWTTKALAIAAAWLFLTAVVVRFRQ